MPEYNYKDIIIDPNDPRVEIGAEYYFGDNVGQLLHGVRTGWKAEELCNVLKAGEYSPFYNGRSGFSCIIRKKELSYAERQEKWIEENDLKKGDRVRVTRKAKSLEDGWQRQWHPYMDEAVGKVGTVTHIFADIIDFGIHVDVSGVGQFPYPYFVLEKVKQKYVPFDLSDKKVRDELRGKWIIPKGHPDSIEKQITLFGSQMTEYGKIWCVDMDITPDKLLASWTFIDGTPCGKLEVVEE